MVNPLEQGPTEVLPGTVSNYDGMVSDTLPWRLNPNHFQNSLSHLIETGRWWLLMTSVAGHRSQNLLNINNYQLRLGHYYLPLNHAISLMVELPLNEFTIEARNKSNICCSNFVLDWPFPIAKSKATANGENLERSLLNSFNISTPKFYLRLVSIATKSCMTVPNLSLWPSQCEPSQCLRHVAVARVNSF